MKLVIRGLHILTLIVVGLVYLPAGTALSKETLTWIQNDWPPVWITEGHDKGNGSLDVLAVLFQSRLPQYEHLQQTMNWTRALHEIKEGSNVVHLAIFKTTERLEFCLFSEPLYVSPTARIIMRNTTIEELGCPRNLSLAELMQDDRFTGLVQKNRSFDQQVDSLITATAAGSNLSSVVMDMDHIITLLMHDRIDYSIEYSIIARYIEKTIYGKTGVLGSLPIEGAPEWVYAHAACPKNAWGRQVIDDINRVIREIKSTPEYLERNKHWFPPDDQAVIEQAYRSGFLQLK